VVLSKRGILDEGIYLTENGADLIKKIKTKPAPARRARPIKSTTDTTTATATAVETLGLDENSRSSGDEKPDNDENQASAETAHKKTLSAPPKRTILLGLGGFNSKSRSRATKTTTINENLLETDSNNPLNPPKRKKKITIEDQMPVNMQEAFFGSTVLAKSREATFRLEEETDETKIKLAKTDLNHHINLDENMLRSAQLSKKGPMELGIEDFLDGDIVSYLFSENRNLIDYPDQDFSSSSRTRNSDEKMFDEKLYEDLFQQMVSDKPTKHNSSSNNPNINNGAPNEYINDSTPMDDEPANNPVDNENLNVIKNNSSHNHLVKSESVSSFDKVRQTPASIQHHQLNHSIINDTKNQIDDLARQFRESTHNLASHLKSNNSNSFTEQFISRSISCPNRFENSSKQESNGSLENLSPAYSSNNETGGVSSQNHTQIIGIISGDSDHPVVFPVGAPVTTSHDHRQMQYLQAIQQQQKQQQPTQVYDAATGQIKFVNMTEVPIVATANPGNQAVILQMTNDAHNNINNTNNNNNSNSNSNNSNNSNNSSINNTNINNMNSNITPNNNNNSNFINNSNFLQNKLNTLTKSQVNDDMVYSNDMNLTNNSNQEASFNPSNENSQ